MAVPALFMAEIAGAISRRTGDPNNGIGAIILIRTVPDIQTVAVDQLLGEHAARIASKFALRGADSIYLALAVNFGAPLVTWDLELLARGRSIADVRTPK